jgi:hypothetical protein
MTVQEQQKLIDRVMHRIALSHGSSTHRDFQVACLVVDEMIASGTVTDAKHSDGTRRSEAP